MDKIKSTKRALIMSAAAVLMSISMLIGTTFAWFTDTSSTAVNKIQTGNLDIEVEYAKEAMDSEGNLTGEITEFKTIKDSTEVFDGNALWEPGRREYVIFRISNKGSLALKYKFNLAVVNQKAGINKDGEEYFLADYLCASAKASEEKNFDYASGLSPNGMYVTLWNDLSAAGTTPALAEKPLSSAAFEGTLRAGEKQAAAMVVWMPTTVGNEANAISPDKAATVDFGINVVATQDTVENDSFGNTYDKDATYPVTDNNGLKDAINNATDGSTVLIISGEYTLSDPAEISKIEIPAGATIAGAGADNTTLNVNNDKIAKDNVTLKDMTIKGGDLQGTSGRLNVNGNNTTIENIDYKGDGNIAIAVSTGGSNSGTTFRGTKITNAFRGIQFWSLSGDSVIDNCVLDVAGYTFNIDAAAAGSTLTITNSTLNGWTSYTSGIDLVTFDSCKLGLNAYSYLRPYSETMLVNCEFTSDGYQLNAGGSDAYTITLTNCTKNGTLITADNVKTLLLDTDEWNSNTTLIVNGVTVSV